MFDRKELTLDDLKNITGTFMDNLLKKDSHCDSNKKDIAITAIIIGGFVFTAKMLINEIYGQKNKDIYPTEDNHLSVDEVLPVNSDNTYQT